MEARHFVMDASPPLAIDHAAVRAQPAPAKVAPLVGQAHVQSFDGVRFFAFLAVFVFHALQNNARLAPFAQYGALGVQVFFVLSGFLIGGILLEVRADDALPLGARLKTFYIRRALRIFPLYYLVLLLLLLLPPLGVTAIGGTEFFFWNAAYLTNFKMFFDDRLGALSHFWSLSVEEHFYLIAPLLMLKTPLRALSVGFVALWVGCAAARVGFALAGEHAAYVLSPLQFDCMTLGIAAAMIQAHGSFLGVNAKTALGFSKLCGALVVPLFVLRHFDAPWARYTSIAFEHWVFAAATAGFLLWLWNSGQGRLARLLALQPLPYLGKISYGLYVFHFPCLVLAYVFLSPYMRHGTALPALVFTLVLSMLSWHLFESPINALKRKFPYRPRA